MIETKNISEMLTSLIETYDFNKNTLSKYLEITEKEIEKVASGDVECLPKEPEFRHKILSKIGFLYFGAIEDKCGLPRKTQKIVRQNAKNPL